MEEKLRIREVVENWVVWRDAGDWKRFRTVWHVDGRMMATWFQGSATRFIDVSREGWNRGVSILHFLGGSSIDIAGERAIAQTKNGFTVKRDMPTLKGPLVEALYRRGAAWLSGSETALP
ncbi:MAG TPA: nuclear transport factor 2 family protein [Casimicrobiaceae bacterium]